jgi:hypothetical protein
VSGRLFLLMLAGLACGGPAASRAPGQVAPWLRADPQRCLLVRDLGEGMEDMARHCATPDSTRWVLEIGEDGPWPGVLEARGGSLGRAAAAVQCSMRQCLVLFRLRRPVLACAFRVVAMTQVFTRIRLVPGDVRDTHCGERRA